MHRDRPRDHVLVRRGVAERAGGDLHQRPGEPHHPFLRGLDRGRREADRRRGQEPGRVQPGRDGLRREAFDWPKVRRRHGPAGRQAAALRGQGAGGQALRRGQGQGHPDHFFARGGERHGAGQDEGDGRGLSGLRGAARRGHRPRLLQRRPAPGHQGRRGHRRTSGGARDQRADGGGAGVRPREQGQGGEHPGLRPRRRDLRRYAPQHRQRRL
mmetsp:Transcript_71126/g.160923  ORF Transcript_71126/g.160923 Transcript_71126/m.160923 type:complete len:213 (+) Transcript_71126:301-939(+)